MNPVYKNTQGFVEKKVSTKQAVAILEKNGIKAGEDEAAIILNFLYMIAKVHSKPKNEICTEIL